jgi:hypothetical protein
MPRGLERTPVLPALPLSDHCEFLVAISMLGSREETTPPGGGSQRAHISGRCRFSGALVHKRAAAATNLRDSQGFASASEHAHWIQAN